MHGVTPLCSAVAAARSLSKPTFCFTVNQHFNMITTSREVALCIPGCDGNLLRHSCYEKGRQPGHAGLLCFPNVWFHTDLQDSTSVQVSTSPPVFVLVSDGAFVLDFSWNQHSIAGQHRARRWPLAGFTRVLDWADKWRGCILVLTLHLDLYGSSQAAIGSETCARG